jgi:hypothetical protein
MQYLLLMKEVAGRVFETAGVKQEAAARHRPPHPSGLRGTINNPRGPPFRGHIDEVEEQSILSKLRLSNS